MKPASLLLSFALAVVSATQPASMASAWTGSATLGLLTLSYDTDQWRVVGSGSAIEIICLMDACAGTAIDARAFASDEYCDKSVAREAAVKAFPWANRHAVNLYTIGNLAVYFGWSAVGLSLDDGRAVFACVNREGTRYEFVSRADAPPVAGLDGLVFQLLRGLAAPPAALHVLDLGGAALAYAADTWDVALADRAAGRWRLSCFPPSCDGIASVEIRAEPIGEDPKGCGGPLLDPARDPSDGPLRSEADIAASLAGDLLPGTEPVVRFGLIDSHCRAMSPPNHVACLVHNGRRFTAWTGLSAGCNGGRPHVPEGTFLHLLRTLTAVE